MSEDSELLTGRAGNEAAQGFTPMPLAVSDPDPEPAMDQHMLDHLRRPEPPAPIEREYVDLQSGEARPSNETVELETAARDLDTIRAQERAAREQQSQDDLRSALDQLPQDGQQPAQDQQPTPQPDELQPEQMDPAQAQDPWAEADRQITEMLTNPVVRERISQEYSQVVQQANAVAEQAKQQAAAVINNLAQEVNVISAALFPELAGLNQEQAKGALAMLAKQNPARVEQIVQFANRVQGVLNAQQQQAFAQQQQQQQQAEVQQRQAAEAFQQYAEAEDAKALLHETPESISAIRKTIFADAEAAGIPKEQLYAAYNSIPALRHSFVQGLLADGAKWRQSQRNLAAHRRNPVPQVQRPGVASAGPRQDDSELSAAASRFNLPGGSEGTQGIKNAAAWLTARRARG